MTARSSAVVKAARRLAKRAFRAADCRFLVEGRQAVTEALAAHALRELFMTDEAARAHPDLVRAASSDGVTLYSCPPDVIAAISDTVTPQGLVGIAPLIDKPIDEALAHKPRLVAVLASVRDPGNLGTVIRAADAAGADAVVITGSAVDVYNSKCVRASVGSLFHLPIAIEPDPFAAMTALRGAGLTILAAAGDGDLVLDTPAADTVFAAPHAWLFGNEAWGLPAEVRNLADRVVAIPIYGKAESLNLATAAAVCLYASARRQRDSG